MLETSLFRRSGYDGTPEPRGTNRGNDLRCRLVQQMMRHTGFRPGRLSAAIMLGLVGILASALPAAAAAPRLVMVYGNGLPQPVILSSWEENGTLLSAATEAADISPESLAGRPYFRLAFFWGLQWDEYVGSGKLLSELKPDQANQYGRYYPATSSSSAVLTFDSIPGSGALTRWLDPRGVAVLVRHGIPSQAAVSTDLSERAKPAGRQPSENRSNLWLFLTLAAAGIVVGAVPAYLALRRR